MSIAEQRIAAALPLVGLISRSVAISLPKHIDIGELEAAGTLGLVEAAGRYDETRGVPFEVFARRRIEGAILDTARRHDLASRTLRRWGRSIHATQQTLLGELGRQPTSDETAARLGISPRKLSRLQARLRDATVLRLEPNRPDDDEPIAEVAGDDDPVAELVHREQLSLLGDALAALPDRLRHVVCSTYIDGRPLADVANELGVTESRISQLRNEALTWLRQVLEPSARPGGSPRDARIAVWGKAVADTRPWRDRITAAA